jgi:bacillithiol biosynthesis cysteine-adding enzyme BshC
MECTCVPHYDLPHSSKLFLDLVYHFDRVRSFYPHAPYDAASYSEAASQVDFKPEQRAALVAALRPRNGDSAALSLLAQPGTVAVVTGQQVGLFSGPAYTIYKALTAVRLARDLTARGIPAVPVFWLATEDHDFAEINHTWTFDSRHQAQKLEIDGAWSPSQPVGGVPITQAPIEALKTAIEGFPNGAQITALVADAYQPGRTLGDAFGALLRSLLPGFDILQINPMDRSIRELAAAPIRKALDVAPELKRLVLARNRELEAAGYHAQVHVEANTSFFFLLENGKRVGLRQQEREYLAPGQRLSTEALMERAGEISPNALLRPVVQDSILPTVAYVGGPAELAYLAQSEVIYRRILGRMPVALSRSGFTLVDGRSRKLMTRYQLSLPDLFHGEDVLRERIAKRLVPPAIEQSMEESKASSARAIEGLEKALIDFDPSLAKAVSHSGRKIRYQVEKLQRKVAREALVRDQRAALDAAELSSLLYPHKHVQERLYSILPFLAQHGTELINHLYENVHLDCPDHKMLVI